MPAIKCVLIGIHSALNEWFLGHTKLIVRFLFSPARIFDS